MIRKHGLEKNLQESDRNLMRNHVVIFNTGRRKITKICKDIFAMGKGLNLGSHKYDTGHRLGSNVHCHCAVPPTFLKGDIRRYSSVASQ
jgi:hypothetical protein